jgi:DNA repair protein RadC
MRYPLIGRIREGQALYRPRQKRYELSKPDAVVALLRDHVPHDFDRELFLVLLLDTRNVLRRLHVVSVGSQQGSIVHPREVFQPAIRYGAAAVILAHNHPSGDPAPSTDDLALTRRLVEAGELVGINVLDHIILGALENGAAPGRYRSMRTIGDVSFR